MNSSSSSSPPQNSPRGIKLRETLMVVEEIDPSFFEVYDKHELRSIGHNLTSVLMNPRESMFDSFMDEFASEQSALVEFSSIPSTPTSYSIFSFSSATSGVSVLPAFSTHSSDSSSISTLTTANLPLYNPIVDPSSDLHRIAQRMRKTLTEYELIRRSNHTATSISLITSQGRSGTRMRDELATCFAQVPTIYFQPDFSLTDSEIFHSDTSHTNNTNGFTITNKAAFQDRLSSYLDKVEVALLRQIWSRAPDFFRALDNITELRACVADACNVIATLRSRLSYLNNQIALTALRIPQLNTRRENEGKLQSRLQLIQRVREGHTLVKSLLRVGDYVGALQLANDTMRLGAPGGELEGVLCIENIYIQLRQAISEIGNTLIRRLVDFALEWTVEDSNTPMSSSNDDINVNGGLSPMEQHDLHPVEQTMIALAAVDLLEQALAEYKNKLCDNVRLVVRTCVTEYMTSFDPLTWSANLGDRLFDEGSQVDDTPFAQRVRAMSSEDFLSSLSLCVENLLLSLQRTNAVHSAITWRVPVSSGASDQRERIKLLSQECVNASCDLAQRSISQLLKIRRETTVRLSIEKMKFLSELCRHFLSSLDDMQSSHNHNSTHAEHKNGHVPSIEGSGEKGRSLAYELRKTLRAQSRGYLDALHESFKQRLVSTLDTDRWSQADVSPERQADIERLISGRSFIVSKATDRPSSSQNNAGNNTEAGDKKRDVRPVMIDGVPYRVVWSCLLLCEQVLVYLEMSNILVCVSSEMVARETAPKIADLLRLFDTRTRLLVLGAGAIQSAARLKSISAKHLAFAAQSLGLIRSLLPHIRAALLAVLPPVHHLLLSELDRVTHDYIDHHSLIVNKLVTIAGDSVDASAQRLRTVDWDRYQGQCPYFEEVLKNLTALHRVLHEALPTALLRDIFSRIFALIGRRICAHFEDQNIMPATQTGRQRILDEISHTLAALALLKDTDPGKSLIAAEEAFRKRYSQS